MYIFLVVFWGLLINLWLVKLLLNTWSFCLLWFVRWGHFPMSPCIRQVFKAAAKHIDRNHLNRGGYFCFWVQEVESVVSWPSSFFATVRRKVKEERCGASLITPWCQEAQRWRQRSQEERGEIWGPSASLKVHPPQSTPPPRFSLVFIIFQ